MAPKTKLCSGCNQQFEARPNAKVCSSRCRKRLYRAKQSLQREVDKLAELRQAAIADIQNSLVPPQLTAVAVEAPSDYDGDNSLGPSDFDFLERSYADTEIPTAVQPVGHIISPRPPVAPGAVQHLVAPVTQSLASQPLMPAPEIKSLETKPSAQHWQQLQNSWQTPPSPPAVIGTPTVLKLDEATTAPGGSNSGSGLSNFFSHRPIFVGLCFMALIVIAAGIFGLGKALHFSSSTSQHLSQLDQALSVDSAAGTLTLNLDTTVAKGKTLTLGQLVAGPDTNVLLLSGDFTASGSLGASGGTSSLNNAGLTINKTLVCTSDGCLPNAAIGVTLQGNTFNGPSQLVQLTGAGLLPVLSGANLTALSGSNISSGTLPDARLSGNVALLNGSGPQTFTGNNKFTGTLLHQNAANSTTAFQIQNAAGTSNLLVVDTVNSKIGILSTPSASGSTLQLSGNLSLVQSSGNVAAISSRVVGDTVDRVQILGDGSIGFGSSNVAAGLNAGDLAGGFRLQADQTAPSTLITYGAGLVRRSFGGAGGTNLQFQGYGGTSANPLATPSGQALGQIIFGGSYDGINATASARIQAFADENFTSSNRGAYVKFTTTPIGSATAVERLRIASSGSVGIGDFSAANPTTTLQVAGNALFKNVSNSTTAFQIQNATSTSNLLVADTTNTRIGVGTASPAVNLDVRGTNANVNVGTASGRLLGVSQTGFGASNGTENVVLATQSGVSFAGTLNTTSFCLITNNNCQQTITSTGATTFKNSTDSTTAFQVQNAAGNQILTTDTSGNQVVLGKASSITGKIVFNGSGGANTITLVSQNNPGGNRTLTLPDETGTLCSTGSVCTGYAPGSGSGSYIQNGTSLQASANFNIQSAAAGNVGGIIRGAAAQTANLTEWQDSAATVLAKVSSAGALSAATFNGNPAALGTALLYGSVTADVAARINITNAGAITWGDGTASGDTNLYRSSADTLKTDDRLQSAVGLDIVNDSGNIRLGISQDSTITRVAARTIDTNSTFRVNQAAASSQAFGAYVGGDTQNRYLVNADGKIQWGNGTAVPDTNLYRSAANTLKTDDSFVATGEITSLAPRSFYTTRGSSTFDPTVTNDMNGTNYKYMFTTQAEFNGFVRLYHASNGDQHGTANFYIDSKNQPSQLLINVVNYRVRNGFHPMELKLRAITNNSFNQSADWYVAINAPTWFNSSTIGVNADVVAYAGTASTTTSGQTVQTINFDLQKVGWTDRNGSTSVSFDQTTGSALFQFATNSTTAFQIQNAAGTSNLLVADTTNTRIGIGASPANALLTIGTNTTAATGGLYFGTDVNLYRSAANILKTDDQLVALGTGTGIGFNYNPATGTGNAFYSIVGADANPMFAAIWDGKLWWGAGGASAQDTNLYRSAANTLKTDDAFVIAGSTTSGVPGGATSGLLATGGALAVARATGSAGLVLGVGGDGQARFVADVDGNLSWGDGTNTRDTNLYRSAADTLKTDDAFVVGTLGSAGTTALCSNAGQISTCTAGGGSTNFIVNGTSLQANANFNIQAVNSGLNGTVGATIQGAAGGQTVDLFQLKNTAGTTLTAFQADGKLVFGPSGAQDTNLYRSAANKLKTDDNFFVQPTTDSASALEVANAAGSVVFAVDTTNAKAVVTGLEVGGSAVFKNAADSTTAFQIQNAAGTSLLTVDTTNLIITLGPASATPVLLVLGNKNTAGDPICTAGSAYYNSNASAFRGCQDTPLGWTNLGNPSGTIVAYAGSTAPSGYLIADGSAISRATYANLFAIIGTTYGVGDGTTTFNLPDLRGRTAVGLNSLNTDVSALGNNEGAVIGSRTPKHKHTVVQPTISQPGVNITDPGHTHTYNNPGAAYNPTNGGDSIANRAAASASTGSTTTGITAALSGAPVASGGTVGPQTNTPTDTSAYLTVNYIIKY